MAWQRGHSYSQDLRERILAVVDAGMSVREIAEELGLAVPAAGLRLLLTDWEPHRGPRSGGLRLVFDGGTLSAEQREQLALPEDELRGWRFMGREEWSVLLPANKRDRLDAALRCRAEGSVGYLEAGEAGS